ncbi:toprim domain-containing protein [Flavobacterium sp. KACC 22761]|uniref:toprim domain-containing protein n=1 Tax=Flavobacterium sp. KACC 22761 TaxID=3092665 RepID=UPI002A761DFC|nr:toprim domain-containing protein [Flavobacterium sp. KACC 22761]WPO78200.1 toprim domain-containing protein [Flavobacterium sp. KACC 22761]
MNSIQARGIPIEKILENLGCVPTKSNENESWYLSPFRYEKTASFKLNRTLNRFFDHGEQKGGNAIDFVIFKFGFSVSEALSYLEKFDTFFSFQKQIFEPSVNLESNVKIEKVIEIRHLALIQYLTSRNILKFEKENNLKEVHYTINSKKYFAIGFENQSASFEIRSKYAKLCIGKKDVSLISNQSLTLRIFEGFFDYLSFVQIRHSKNLEQSDYLILNSVALLVKKKALLEKYENIELYLDNDQTGDKYTTIILEQFPDSLDLRKLYENHKDLNEWLTKGK